jgi:hypothetical protein
MIGMGMRSNYYRIQALDALLLEISQRQAIVVTAINQRCCAIRCLNENTITLIDIDEMDL